MWREINALWQCFNKVDEEFLFVSFLFSEAGGF